MSLLLLFQPATASSGTLYTRPLNATYAGTGLLNKRDTKNLSATFLTSGIVISKAIMHVLTATYSVSGSISKATTRTLNASYVTTGALLKATGRIFVAVFSNSGLLTAQKFSGSVLHLQALSATFSTAGMLTKTANRLLSATCICAGSLMKSMSKLLLASVTWGTGAATNLLINPNYEQGTVTSDLSSYYNGSLSISTAQVFSGTSSLSVFSPDSSNVNGFIQFSPNFVAAGTVINTSSFWLWIPSGTTVQAGNRGHNAGGAPVGEFTVNQTIVGNSAWQQVTLASYTYRTAPFAPGIEAYINPAQAGVTFYVDQAIMSTSVTSYFDGSSPGANWSGATNLSQSILPTSILKQTNRNLSAVFSSSGLLTALRAHSLTLVATFMTSGVITKRAIGRPLAGVYSMSGNLNRRTARSLIAGYQTFGSLTKTARKKFNATYSSLGFLSGAKGFVKKVISNVISIGQDDQKINLSSNSNSVAINNDDSTINM
jgi:hypothetical protein